MDLIHARMLRLFLAGTIFWMALVLTPRAWVESPQVNAQSEQVPVRLLDSAEECIWCDPYPALEPVRCADSPQADAPLWLNPDEAIEAPAGAPCTDKDDDHPTA